MSVYQNIAYDYDKITALIYDIRNLGRKATPLRIPLLHMLEREVLILNRAEKRVLYRPLEEIGISKNLVSKLENQAREIEKQFYEIESLKENSEEWHKAFEALAENILMHIETDQEDFFPLADGLLKKISPMALEEKLANEKNRQWGVGLEVQKISPTAIFMQQVRQSQY